MTGTFIDTSVGGTPNGVIGGGHVGYNLQINQWVLGLEGTVDGTSLSNTSVVAFPVAFGGSTLTAHTTADIQGSIRGRLGVAWDRALIYATGGVAFGGFNTNVSLSGVDVAGVPFFVSASRSNTRVGWTVGGGIEYAITNNWSIRADDAGAMPYTTQFNNAYYFGSIRRAVTLPRSRRRGQRARPGHASGEDREKKEVYDGRRGDLSGRVYPIPQSPGRCDAVVTGVCPRSSGIASFVSRNGADAAV